MSPVAALDLVFDDTLVSLTQRVPPDAGSVGHRFATLTHSLQVELPTEQLLFDNPHERSSDEQR